MSKPLSSLASVITIVGSATETIKVLLTFFRKFRNAPAQIHQWLTMLAFNFVQSAVMWPELGPKIPIFVTLPVEAPQLCNSAADLNE